MRSALWVVFIFILALAAPVVADKKWDEFDKKIADRMRSKNLTYKIKDDEIKAQLSSRIKKLIQGERGRSQNRPRIYRYIDRSGKQCSEQMGFTAGDMQKIEAKIKNLITKKQ